MHPERRYDPQMRRWRWVTETGRPLTRQESDEAEAMVDKTDQPHQQNFDAASVLTG